jgi:putative tryptophan/tyrosine transport system substrate-binding protein
MRRRELLQVFGGALAWPLAARAEQPGPVIGLLHAASASYFAQLAPSFAQGLKESGYTPGQKVAIEYRWAEGHYDRLPALAAELVARQVAVIVAGGGTTPAKAAKAATSTIPIVFISAADPVKAGIVDSLNRPGGNVTGVSLIGSALEAKKLGLLHEVAPGASTVAALINPNYADAKMQVDEVAAAAARIGVELVTLRAGNAADIDAAFASLLERGAGALLVGEDVEFAALRRQIVALAAHHAIPTIYFQKEFVAAGGLISYGPHFADGYRQAGIYVSRILKGEKPAELPIMQPTKFEMVINLKTAKALGVEIPPMLLATADEVIE